MDVPIVRPVCGPKAPRLGPLAVMVSNRGDLDAIAAAMPAGWDGGQRNLFNSRLHLSAAPSEACLVGPVMAAAYAVMLLETLAAWGVRRVLYVGWCGALDDGLQVGDVLMPVLAVVDEGTSPAYGQRTESRVRPASAWQAAVGEALATVTGRVDHRRRIPGDPTPGGAFRRIPPGAGRGNGSFGPLYRRRFSRRRDGRHSGGFR
jgi:hypothetical protein